MNIVFYADEEIKLPFGLLRPNSKCRAAWSTLLMIIVMQTAVVTPVRVAFVEETPDDLTWHLVDIAADLIFLLDIFVNFMTIQENANGTLITDRKVLAIKYIKSWFLVDFISSIPINIITL